MDPINDNWGGEGTEIKDNESEVPYEDHIAAVAARQAPLRIFLAIHPYRATDWKITNLLTYRRLNLSVIKVLSQT